MADLSDQFGEPRVIDLRIAEVLGFRDPMQIRPLIKRHLEALQRFGEVSCICKKPGKTGGRPGTEFWLNKRQALYITAKSDTPRAADLTVQMVDVFDAYLQGQAPKKLPRQKPQGLVQPVSCEKGRAFLRIGSRMVLVDIDEFEFAKPTEAVVMDRAGRVRIEKVSLPEGNKRRWHGQRWGTGEWHMRDKPDAQGCVGYREDFVVLGRVLSTAPAKSRDLIAN